MKWPLDFGEQLIEPAAQSTVSIYVPTSTLTLDGMPSPISASSADTSTWLVAGWLASSYSVAATRHGSCVPQLGAGNPLGTSCRKRYLRPYTFSKKIKSSCLNSPSRVASSSVRCHSHRTPPPMSKVGMLPEP